MDSFFHSKWVFVTCFLSSSSECDFERFRDFGGSISDESFVFSEWLPGELKGPAELGTFAYGEIGNPTSVRKISCTRV